MKKIKSKKWKLMISSLSAFLIVTPIVAASAVACSAQVLAVSEITISEQPSNKTAFMNQNENLPTFSVVAKTDNKNTKLVYQWYENDNDSTVSGKPIEGATNSTYIISPNEVLISGIKYFYVVVSEYTENVILNSVISNVATLTVLNKTPPITITNQPANQKVIINQSENLPTFSIDATTNNSEQKLTYQWYSNATESNTNGTPIKGATQSSYTVSYSDINTVGTKYFYVKISGSINGAILSPVISNAASLTVDPMPTISVSVQPENKTVYANQTANLPTFSVTATSNNQDEKLTYQWYSNTTSSIEGAIKITGATDSTYTTTEADIGNVGDKKYFYVQISGSINGISFAPVNSDIVSLTTQAASTITISTQPTAEQIVAKDASVSLSVAATSTVANTLTYQWQKANSDTAEATWTDIPGANAATYTFNENNDYSTITYYRVVVGQEGTSATATSANAKVTVGYTNAQAQAQMNAWLANPVNQESLLNSYFKTSNPLSIFSSTNGFNIIGIKIVTIPEVKDITVTPAKEGQNQFADAHPLPFDTYKVDLTTASAGAYQTWTGSDWSATTTSIPIDTPITIYLPFGFKNVSFINNSNINVEINILTSLSNNTSSISWTSPQGDTGDGIISNVYVSFLTNVISFQFPNYYTINNTNSDLPTYIIAP